MMTLQEAIRHCEETADRCQDECGAEHRQLAEWLQELQDRRDAEPGHLTDDLISRQTAISKKMPAVISGQGTDVVLVSELKNLPSAQSEEPSHDAVMDYCRKRCLSLVDNELLKRSYAQKLGKWERHWSRPGVYADLCWHCSACGGRTNMSWAHIYYKYCPYCGVRMARPRGEYEEDSNG